MKHVSVVLVALVALPACSAAQNLLRNAGFEFAPEGNVGQGLMPDDWFATSLSPDTYSNDGSFGLAPGGVRQLPWSPGL